MNDEARRILRCHLCDEASMVAQYVSDEMRAAGWVYGTHATCAHEHACKRAYRLGAADVREAMNDDRR